MALLFKDGILRVDAKVQLIFAAVVLASVLLNFACLAGAKYTSPSTLSVVGNMKAAVQSIIGFYTFSAVATVSNVLGVTFVNLGALSYLAAKRGAQPHRPPPLLAIDKDGAAAETSVERSDTDR